MVVSVRTHLELGTRIQGLSVIVRRKNANTMAIVSSPGMLRLQAFVVIAVVVAGRLDRKFSSQPEVAKRIVV